MKFAIDIENEEIKKKVIKNLQDENVLSKVMSFNFEALLEEFNLKQLFMKNGRELYLIKNIECASIIIRMTTSNIYNEEKIAKFLCDLIEMISSKSHKI